MSLANNLLAIISRCTSPQASAAFHDLVTELKVAWVHRVGVRKARDIDPSKLVKIQFGGGALLLDGFFNVDFHPESDVRLDLRRPLPFPDGVAEMIFSEHFLEHLAYPEEVGNFLGDCYRILRPGGRILLSVPDSGAPFREYPDPESKWLKQCQGEFSWWHPPECETFMEHLDFHSRQRQVGAKFSHFECHRANFDEETLAKALRSVGFSDPSVREFEEGLDHESRRIGSLRMQAIKPEA